MRFLAIFLIGAIVGLAIGAFGIARAAGDQFTVEIIGCGSRASYCEAGP